MLILITIFCYKKTSKIIQITFFSFHIRSNITYVPLIVLYPMLDGHLMNENEQHKLSVKVHLVVLVSSELVM